METINYPNKLKLHDTFVTDLPEEDCYKWHGNGFFREPSLLGCSTEELVSKIRDYLSKKERLNFYYLFHCGADNGIGYYRSFSDDDVAFIKKEFEMDEGKAFENDDDVTDWYIKFPGGVSSPKNPIWKLTALGPVYAGEPIQIYLGEAKHFYAMSKSFCDIKDGGIRRTSRFGVELSDDDYVYLVHQIITHDFEYFFTDLALVETELAKKIYMYSTYSNPDLVPEDYDVRHLPFLIRFDELEEDARKIVSMNTSPKVQL